MTSDSQLLADPFLQWPTENSVRVVWFTEFVGSSHTVAYGKVSIPFRDSYAKATVADTIAHLAVSGDFQKAENSYNKIAIATTTQLSRTLEDQKSRVGSQTQDGTIFQKPTIRNIWRHEAEIADLTPGETIPYRVTSVREDGKTVNSAEFTLAPAPVPGTPLKILLTSDHQLRPMTAANLQKVAETIGRVDAVFHAGDLVNIPDRASEWFDDNRGGAFFPCLQGRANYELENNGIKTVYNGGELIQHAPLFCAIGNHEVMGRLSADSSLNDQFSDAFPRAVAKEIYDQNAAEWNPTGDRTVREALLKANSFNVDTYEEIFTLPQSRQGGKKYYAVTFGDIRLVTLFITNIWRHFHLDADTKGRYQERKQDLNNPSAWGYGQHIFEPIVKGSEQYIWLQEELSSPEFKQAKYKIVMFHHPPHTLGGNIVPAYTDPVQVIDRNPDGTIKAIRYEYPKNDDYIIRDVVPMLEAANVQFVYYGHSHLWNRFVSSKGMHFLESSNVGNSYGAALGDNRRPVPVGYQEEYVEIGDPNGLEAVVPAIAPLIGEDGQPQPYIGSNDITAFSIFDTQEGMVSSYYFDTRKPESKVVKFDEFKLS